MSKEELNNLNEKVIETIRSDDLVAFLSASSSLLSITNSSIIPSSNSTTTNTLTLRNLRLFEEFKSWYSEFDSYTGDFEMRSYITKKRLTPLQMVVREGAERILDWFISEEKGKQDASSNALLDFETLVECDEDNQCDTLLQLVCSPPSSSSSSSSSSPKKKDNKLRILKKLIEFGEGRKFLSLRNKLGSNCLHSAIINNELEILQYLLTSIPSTESNIDANTRVEYSKDGSSSYRGQSSTWTIINNKTPLHLACGSHFTDTNGENKRLAIIKLLIQSGADVNAESQEAHETPLHVVKCVSFAKLLLENGADIDKKTKQVGDSRPKTAEEYNDQAEVVTFLKRWRKERK